MDSERSIQRYRKWYVSLLRFYSKPYYERFGEGMEQTFHDLLRERRDSHKRLIAFVLWSFVETSAQIVKENFRVMIEKKLILRPAIATGLLLMVPLVAMRFSHEVVWTFFDFVVAGILLFGAGLTYELIAKKARHFTYRAAAALAVGTALFLVWANLAVGLIGSENNPANLMYIGVLAVGIIGATLARFRPVGMARALFAMALAQMLVAVIALAAGMQRSAGSSVAEILGVNGFFVVLFVASALLFQRASAAQRM